MNGATSSPTVVDVQIRPYHPSDRAAVRQICCGTADRGEDVETVFRDREVFADLVSSYYTDYEPTSTWIAESHGDVIGYLTGCLESGRYRRVMAWRIVPHAMLRAISRGNLLSAQTWRLSWAGLQTWLRGGTRWPVPVASYPAHLHVNLQKGFRGQHIGHRLVERFLDQARAAQLGGAHVAVRSDNRPSRTFFEGLGFIELGRHRVVFPQGMSYETHETIIYGTRL